MTSQQRQLGPAARYFEDFTPGERIVTQGRTMTRADGLFWSMYSGDMNPMHVDDDFSGKHGIFGGAFPPGLASIALMSGLTERLGIGAGTALAILEQTIRYKTPVLFGDTIHVELTVKELKAHASKPRGMVLYEYRVVKQDGSIAIEGEWRWLFASRAADAGDSTRG